MENVAGQQDTILIGERAYTAERVIEVLGPILTPERRARIQHVAAHRTRTIIPVTEGLYDRGNVSAVLRSAEALGYQSVHIVDSSAQFKQANRVTQGAEKWLDVRVWEATAPCVAHLRGAGYRILATTPEEARPIDSLRFDLPTALFLGNEKDGVSQELLQQADERVAIPMPGFTRSFNISVAAALCLYHIQQWRIRECGGHGDLDAHEQTRLLAEMYLRSVEDAARILERMG